MELLTYWKVIRKRLWLIVLLVVLGGSSAAYYTSRQVPVYSTTTTLFINPAQVSPIVPGDPSWVSGSSRSETLMNTYAELMRTRSFTQRVAQEMGDVSEGVVAGALSSQSVEGTQFFRISATHTDPELARRLANTAADVLIAREVQRQQAQQQQMEAQRGTDQQRLELQRLIASLESERNYYTQQIESTQNQIAVLENRSRPDGRNDNSELDALYKRLPELRYTGIDVQTRLAEAQGSLSRITTTNTAPVDTAVVVDKAPLPSAPLSNSPIQRILLAMGVGLMIGAGLSFLLEYLDYTIKTPEALDELYKIPVQGVISQVDRKHFKKQGSVLVALSESRSPTAEAFRALRTGIQVDRLNAPLRSLLITSAGPGEGKTFVAANLGASLALAGNRVIIIDTDLRRPHLHQVFDLPRGIGFTNLVVNQQHTLDEALQETPIKNLYILTCGTIPPNPAELLGSIRAEEVMQQITAAADIVIFDSPPAATVTDAAILAQRVDGVLHVVWAGHTRINLVLRCKSVLEQVGARILGPVLNNVSLPDLGYYSYYYNYGYYHVNGNGHNPSLWRKLLPRRRRSKHSRSGEPHTHTNGTPPDPYPEPETDTLPANGQMSNGDTETDQ